MPRIFLRRLGPLMRRGRVLRRTSRCDGALFPCKPDAFQIVDASDLLQGIPTLTVKPRCTQFSDRFEQSDVQQIIEHKLDVLLRLGFRILRGEILRRLTCGVWSFHHGDSRTNRGGPPGFWEVMEATPTTGSVLQQLTEELDGGPVICRSAAATDLASVHRNRNNFYWKSLAFVPLRIKELRRLGTAGFLERVRKCNSDPSVYSQRLYRTPRNLEFAGLLCATWAATHGAGSQVRVFRPVVSPLLAQRRILPAAVPLSQNCPSQGPLLGRSALHLPTRASITSSSKNTCTRPPRGTSC